MNFLNVYFFLLKIFSCERELFSFFFVIEVECVSFLNDKKILKYIFKRIIVYRLVEIKDSI